MSAPQSSREILDREFLPTRAKILEIAAVLDRLTRAGDESDPRRSQLLTGLELVLDGRQDRAEQVQLHFSLLYDAQWRSTLDVKK